MTVSVADATPPPAIHSATASARTAWDFLREESLVIIEIGFLSYT